MNSGAPTKLVRKLASASVRKSGRPAMKRQPRGDIGQVGLVLVAPLLGASRWGGDQQRNAPARKARTSPHRTAGRCSPRSRRSGRRPAAVRAFPHRTRWPDRLSWRAPGWCGRRRLRPAGARRGRWRRVRRGSAPRKASSSSCQKAMPTVCAAAGSPARSRPRAGRPGCWCACGRNGRRRVRQPKRCYHRRDGGDRADQSGAGGAAGDLVDEPGQRDPGECVAGQRDGVGGQEDEEWGAGVGGGDRGRHLVRPRSVARRYTNSSPRRRWLGDQETHAERSALSPTRRGPALGELSTAPTAKIAGPSGLGMCPTVVGATTR